MSDKRAIEKQSKISLDDLSENEMSSASDALFNEFSKGARQLFKGAMQLAEKTHDGSAAFLSMFMGESAAENHTKSIEKEAAKALQRGDLKAAEHFIKRDLQFTSWTQSMDDEDTQRLLKEWAVIQKAETLQEKERTAERKVAKPSTAGQLCMVLADLMLRES